MGEDRSGRRTEDICPEQLSSRIYFAEISGIESAETANLMDLISDERRKKLNQYRFSIDRKLSLYAELLVRWQAMSSLCLNNSEIEFGKNEHGKPFIQGYSSFHFNISHTRNAIAVAFSNDEIGIDIEKIKTADFQILKRYFTSLEQEFILSHIEPEHAFYEIWTKKEAYAKYTGEGLTMAMVTFNVLNTSIISKINTFPIKNYMISVCNEKPETNYNLIELLEKQIVEMFLYRV